MVTLYSMLWVSAAFFAILGLIRGLRREIVVLAGVVLVSFVLYQFDALLRGLFLASIPRDQACLVQLIIFGTIMYFAYQTRSFNTAAPNERTPNTNRTQDAILGGLLGGVNGYMIWGLVWYLLDINDYPFAPLLSAPAPNSISAQAINSIPLVAMGSIVGGGQGMIVLVVLMFALVLFMI